MIKNKKKQQLRPVDQPFFNYWQAMYMALYSPKLYLDVAKRWKGYGALYLLLLLTLICIPLSAKVIIDFNRYFNEKIVFPLEQLPLIYTQKGKVSFDKPMPYLIKNKKGEVVVIVDTTGEYQKIDNKFPEQTILITKNALHMRFQPPKLFFKIDIEPTTTEIVQELSKGDNEVFVGKDWVQSSGILKLKYVPIILLYPIIVLFFFAMYYSLFLVLALLGQVFAKIFFDMKFTFKQSCRLFSVAATAQVIFFFFMLTTDNVFTGLGLVYVSILTIYYSYAVVCVKRGSNKMVHS